MERETLIPGHTVSFGSNLQYDLSNCHYIARGTFGVVYKTRITQRFDYEGGEEIAVKKVHLRKEEEFLNSGHGWTPLIRRWKTLLHLRHRHLVPYHKVSITGAQGGPTVDFVMDLCKGGDLTSFMNERKRRAEQFPQSEVLCFAMQITNGVHYLHQNNIIHGDLKPRNVLIKDTGSYHLTLQVGDLDDLVHMRQSLTSARDILAVRGTIRYMSPEMLKKFAQEEDEEPNIGRKSDLWSLGCIILDLANCHIGNSKNWLHNHQTGEYFHVDDTAPDSLHAKKMVDGFVPHVSRLIPKKLATVIRRCLCVDITTRITADVLLHQLSVASETVSNVEFPAKEHPECFCFERMPVINRPPISDEQSTTEGILLIHQFCSLDKFLHTSFQLLKPDYGTLREVSLPENLREKRFLQHFLADENKIMCYTEAAFPFGNADLVECDVGTNALRCLFRSLSLPAHISSAVAVGNEIFCWVPISSFPLQAVNTLSGAVSPMPKPLQNGSILLNMKITSAKLLRHGNKLICLGNDARRDADWAAYFDTQTKLWELLPPMPAAREGYSAVVARNYIYVLGGRDTFECLASCVRLNMTSLIWEPVPDLLRPRADHAAFLVRNRICIFGGKVGDEHSLSQTMECYNIRKDQWSAVEFDQHDCRRWDDRILQRTQACYLVGNPDKVKVSLDPDALSLNKETMRLCIPVLVPNVVS